MHRYKKKLLSKVSSSSYLALAHTRYQERKLTARVSAKLRESNQQNRITTPARLTTRCSIRLNVKVTTRDFDLEISLKLISIINYNSTIIVLAKLLHNVFIRHVCHLAQNVKLAKKCRRLCLLEPLLVHYTFWNVT